MLPIILNNSSHMKNSASKVWAEPSTIYKQKIYFRLNLSILICGASTLLTRPALISLATEKSAV